MEEIRPILLAEDNPRDIELIQEALAEHNLVNRLVVVHDGVELLDCLHGRGACADKVPLRPVLIILDIYMPRMDGVAALREIRKDPHLKRIPVVILTGSNEATDLQTSYELGVNAYVVKPVDFHQFVEVVKNLGMFWALHNQPPVA